MLEGWADTSIEVIPAVDVLGREAVRLHKGDYAEVIERPGEPAALARAFAAAGAARIHLVDLDGARSGRVRPELVREIAAAAAPAAIQASGGIRALADAEALLEAGADRVVVGTAAFPDPAPWAESLGEKLVVALDARDGHVRTAGWTEAALPLTEALDRCTEAGVLRVLCTSIDRDGTLGGPDLELVLQVARSGLRVLAAGGIRSPADVDALAAAGAEAAVVGRALLSAPSGPRGERPSGSF
jgi:phosphoribosylformimino-5-aminoimidazole carboxamide ribotide isomerase